MKRIEQTKKKDGRTTLFTDNEVKKIRSKTNRNYTDTLKCFSVQWKKLSNGLNRTQSTQNMCFILHDTNFCLSGIYPEISPIPLPTPLEKSQGGYRKVPQG